MKKALSLILAMLMVASVFSVCAFAATTVEINKAVATYDGVELGWNSVAGVECYHIYRYDMQDEPIESTKKTSFVDEEVEYNEKYKYAIVAEYENGEFDDLDFGNGKSVTYNHIKVTGVFNNYNGVNLKWDNIGKKYFIFRKDKTSGFKHVAETTTNSYVDTNVDYMGKYEYAITVVDEYDSYENLDTANPVSATYNLIDIKSSTSKNTGIVLKWAAVEGAIGYEIYRKQAGKDGKLVGATSSLNFTDVDVKNGSTYYYVIVPVDANYESNKDVDYNNGIKIKHQLVEITDFEMDFKGLRISWTSLSTASNYMLHRRSVVEDNNVLIYGDSEIIAYELTKAEYFDKSVKENETYQYAVAVQYKNGELGDPDFSRAEEITYSSPICSRVNDDGKHADDPSTDKIVVVKEATVYETGIRYYVCSECGKRSENKIIPQLAPKAPKILSISNNVKGVKLVWEVVDSAEIYLVYRRIAGGSWDLIRMTTANNMIDQTPVSGKYYTYMVKALNKNALVRKVEAYKNDNERNVLEWEKDSYTANGYLIYRKEKVNGEDGWKIYDITNNKTVKNEDGKSVKKYTDTTTKKDKQYCVRSVLISKMGETKAIRYVAAPKKLSVENRADGILFKWNAVKNATGYRVYRKTASDKDWSFLKQIKTTKYLDKTAESGVDYVYTVIAVYNRVFSKYQYDGVSLTRLSTPELNSAKSTKEGIVVNWDDVDGAESYTVYRKTANSGWKILGKVTDVRSTTYLDKSAKKGVKYTYTVRAVDGSSRSSYESAGVSCKDKY